MRIVKGDPYLVASRVGFEQLADDLDAAGDRRQDFDRSRGVGLDRSGNDAAEADLLLLHGRRDDARAVGRMFRHEDRRAAANDARCAARVRRFQRRFAPRARRHEKEAKRDRDHDRRNHGDRDFCARRLRRQIMKGH